MGHHSLPSVWTYFTIERFDWNAREIGYSFAFIGILMAFTQAVLLQKVVPVLGQYKAALIGFAFCILSFIGYSIASSGWMLYMFMVPGALRLARLRNARYQRHHVGAGSGELARRVTGLRGEYVQPHCDLEPASDDVGLRRV